MADAGPPKHKDIFAEAGLGAGVSLGDGDAFAKAHVPGKKRPEFDALGLGGNKRNILSMKAALGGVAPSAGADGKVAWTALSGREPEHSHNRTFSRADDGGGTKEFSQRLFRSGSIIEEHRHLDAKGAASRGAVMHKDRHGRIQFLDNARRDKVASAAFPSSTVPKRGGAAAGGGGGAKPAP